MADGSEPIAPTLDLRPKRFCTAHRDWHAKEEFGEHCEAYTGSKPIRLCKVCGGWHPLDQWSGNCLPPLNMNRSELASPQVVRDGMDDVLHPITQRPYDSKRALRADYRARGLEEVGNEEPKSPQVREPDDKDIVQDIKRAYEELTSDSFSNDQMSNMLRPENAPIEGGMTVV